MINCMNNFLGFRNIHNCEAIMVDAAGDLCRLRRTHIIGQHSEFEHCREIAWNGISVREPVRRHRNGGSGTNETTSEIA